ncbi:hypothetical protein BDD43_0406 [Mucilaginibacter gracilis]|uniref:Uncharacterized protein n=1 Tax=Mucilaginibacter gracilis TaxID=423350 RepID=A0A495IWR1_9SPHI|nr:YtxH domain-containing protein [Mucilaginibacter gracilis]RKR80309.1 hypothetical protein BDD43_0406 [Mucilaginibacter gracilis]
MGFIKTFVLGAAVAYGVQHITKKREDGSSILSDFLDNPSDLVNKAKAYAEDTASQVARSVKEKVVL